MMNAKLISIIKYIAFLVAAIALLAFAFKGVDIKDILYKMLQAKVSWLLLSVAIGIMAFISRAYRWTLLIEPLGYKPSLRKTTYALMIGYLVNLAFPRLGEITRCGTLSKAESIPFSNLFGTVIVERVIDLISLMICVFLAAFLEYKRLGNFLSNNIFRPIAERWEILIDSPKTIIIVVALFVIIIFLIVYWKKKMKKNENESRFAKIIHGLINGLRSLSKLKRPWLFLFHSIFIWILYFLGTYVVFFALPSTSELGLSAALFLLVIGGLGMSAPVQGGIGVYHLLVSQGLLLYGLTQQDGLTFATLLHSLSFMLVIICGVVAMLLLFSENKKRLRKQEIENQIE